MSFTGSLRGVRLLAAALIALWAVRNAAVAAWPATSPDGPIETAGDALSRSMAHVPAGKVVDHTVVRRTTHAELEAKWLSWSAEDVGSTGWPPEDPVWLVGVQVDGLDQTSLATQAGMPADELSGTAESGLAGLFFAWDGGSGDLRAHGGLGPGYGPRQLEALQAWPAEDEPPADLGPSAPITSGGVGR
jgi:hypothetical protein